MVRFSDIIKLKSKKRRGDHGTVNSAKGGGARPIDPDENKVFDKEFESEPSIDLSQLKNDIAPEIIEYYEFFLGKATEVRDRIENNKGVSPSPILSELHTVMDKELVDDLYEYAMAVSPEHDDMLVHTLDVMFTCLKAGKGLGYDTKTLLRLGLAAFLENVGMYKIPGDILNKEGKLSSNEVAVIKGHPKISSEILEKLGEQYKWLAEVALQVHERSDGSGYPAGLRSEQISELASIIGLVDSYVAMIKKRPYREKFMETTAVKSIIEGSKGLFPANIIKIFLNQITLFPINSYVRLNNKSIGRVISTNHSQPLKPTIELVYDGLGNRVKERQIIHLPENPLLYIERSVNKGNQQ